MELMTRGTVLTKREKDKVVDGDAYSDTHEVMMHRSIKKITEDIDLLKANTAIATLMSMMNAFYDKGVNMAEYKAFLTLINPFAPHITEELWQQIGGEGLLSVVSWPRFEASKTVENTVEIAVQINGKLKTTISMPLDSEKEAALATAKAEEKVVRAIADKTIVKEVFVPNKIVNLVVR